MDIAPQAANTVGAAETLAAGLGNRVTTQLMRDPPRGRLTGAAVLASDTRATAAALVRAREQALIAVTAWARRSQSQFFRREELVARVRQAVPLARFLTDDDIQQTVERARPPIELRLRPRSATQRAALGDHAAAALEEARGRLEIPAGAFVPASAILGYPDVSRAAHDAVRPLVPRPLRPILRDAFERRVQAGQGHPLVPRQPPNR